MKQRIFVISVIVLLLVFLLPAASSGLLNAGVAHAEGGGVTLDEGRSLRYDLNVTISSYNPPVTVSGSGGSFQYEIAAENQQTSLARFDIWTTITLPDGSTIDGSAPVEATVPGSWSISRNDLIQEIPAEYPTGTYTYNAYAGRYPDRLLASDSFTFEKVEAGGWYGQSSGTGDWFFDIHFADANNGWAVGQTNEIVHTNNGGDTWVAQQTPIFVNLWSVFAADAQNAWAGGSNGVLLNTNDGGDTWTTQLSGGSSAWWDIFFLDENNGWVVGGKAYDFTASRRVILHTSDGGQTWETQYSKSYESPLKAVHFVDANNGWAVGEGIGILHTSDGGDTWTTQTTGTSEYFESVYFTDVKTGYAVGRDGLVVYTTDGGNSWGIQNLGGAYDLTGIDFVDANNGWISGIDQGADQAIILRTDDGGATWHNQDPGPATILFDVVFTDANNGWAAGDNGTIIHTDSGGE